MGQTTPNRPHKIRYRLGQCSQVDSLDTPSYGIWVGNNPGVLRGRTRLWRSVPVHSATTQDRRALGSVGPNDNCTCPVTGANVAENAGQLVRIPLPSCFERTIHRLALSVDKSGDVDSNVVTCLSNFPTANRLSSRNTGVKNVPSTAKVDSVTSPQPLHCRDQIGCENPKDHCANK